MLGSELHKQWRLKCQEVSSINKGVETARKCIPLTMEIKVLGSEFHKQ